MQSIGTLPILIIPQCFVHIAILLITIFTDSGREEKEQKMKKWKFYILIILVVLAGGFLPATAAPVTDFTGSPVSGTAPLSVLFIDNSTGTEPLTYAWDFTSDGSVDSIEQNPTRVYSTAGTFTVKLTVSGPDGSSDEVKMDYITVDPAPVAPTAQFSGNVTSGTAPLAVKFTDESTGTHRCAMPGTLPVMDRWIPLNRTRPGYTQLPEHTRQT